MWYLLPYSHCDGQRQSPVNIDTKKAVVDKHLGAFTFKGFKNREAIENIINTGHTGVNALLKILSVSLFRFLRDLVWLPKRASVYNFQRIIDTFVS